MNEVFVMLSGDSSWYANSTNISFFQNGVGGVAFSNVTVSEGLYDAWPDRQS